MSPPVGSASEPEAAGFVLAGGRSSRMGSDKALVELCGEPLIRRALAVLRGAGLEAAIVGAQPDLSEYGRVVADAGGGPLDGVCSALESTTADFAVFLSVDMPLLPSALVAFLLDRARRTGAGIILVSVSGFAQTFPAVIHRSSLPALQCELHAGNGGCFSAFRAATGRLRRSLQILPVEDLVQAGHVADPRGLPAAFWFLNVNTPDDLARAQLLLVPAVT